MERRKQYYALLLEKCLNLKEINRPLFLVGNKICLKYLEEIKEMALNLGIEDIYMDIQDKDELMDILNKTDIDDIKNNPYFDCHIWDTYALKGAAFLMLKTEMPNYMDSVDKDKLVEASRVMSNTSKEYKRLQLKYEIPWTIALLPCELWAKKLNCTNDELFNIIMDLCMVDDNVMDNWDKQIGKNGELVSKLNGLKISKLFYESPKGTNLEIGLSPYAIWKGTDKGNMIVNMPTYEAFTVPDCHDINGVVFSTRPLSYNGVLIDDFNITFKDGKIIDVEARVGKDALQALVGSCVGSNSLGEVALVDNRTPIASSKYVFENTLLDENASCHLAIGNGFPLCIENYDEKDLEKVGFNRSLVHVDFMIGGKDLNIYALTNKGRILLMNRGEICL